MIWWKGCGILVPIFFFVVIFTAEILAETFLGGRIFDDRLAWGFDLALVIAGLLVWLCRPRQSHMTGDTKKGDFTSYGDAHSFVSISMRSWALVMIGGGVVMYLVQTFVDGI